MFSVVIPVRNRATFIAAAVQSVQAQSLAVDEMIVVDDASTDRTLEVLQQLAAGERRIRLIPLPSRGGANRARNVGIESASGTWISFLDSDDLWLPTKHAEQVARLASEPRAVASFTGRIDAISGAVILPPARVGFEELRRYNCLGGTSSAMIRREALHRVGGFDPNLPSCQDWDLWLKLARLGQLITVRLPLMEYSHTDPARISRDLAKVLEGHRTVFERALFGATGRQRREIRAHHSRRLAEVYLWDLARPGTSLQAALLSMLRSPTAGAAALLPGIVRSLLNRINGVRSAVLFSEFGLW